MRYGVIGAIAAPVEHLSGIMDIYRYLLCHLGGVHENGDVYYANGHLPAARENRHGAGRDPGGVRHCQPTHRLPQAGGGGLPVQLFPLRPLLHPGRTGRLRRARFVVLPRDPFLACWDPARHCCCLGRASARGTVRRRVGADRPGRGPECAGQAGPRPRLGTRETRRPFPVLLPDAAAARDAVADPAGDAGGRVRTTDARQRRRADPAGHRNAAEPAGRAPAPAVCRAGIAAPRAGWRRPGRCTARHGPGHRGQGAQAVAVRGLRDGSDPQARGRAQGARKKTLH